jgi:isopropylmalate/homocitrate/citramalate synthase
MRPETIFSEKELQEFREALADVRPLGPYSPGRWMVNPLNRDWGTTRGNFPKKVRLRDITLRTMEQMPGVVSTPAERRTLLCALVEAGVPEVVTSAFRYGHSEDEMQAEVKAAKSVSRECDIVFCNPVNQDELETAARAGYDVVQIWNSPFLGKAMPVSAGAVYHRVWQERDWHDLRIPKTPEAHLDRPCRLTRAGAALGLKVDTWINMIAFASEEYVATYCRAIADAGAHQVTLADSSAGTGPEAMARLVEVAKAAVPHLKINVHTHNMFGMGIAAAIAAARAGAETIDVSISGYEVGPGGSQASLVGTAAALEALYGVDTGIDLSRMNALAEMAAKMTGVAMPWNEPILGSCGLDSALPDEYEMEAMFDPLIHCSIAPEAFGSGRRTSIGVTTGPLVMWHKLEELGITAGKRHVIPILKACKALMATRRRALSDEEIRTVAQHVLRTEAAE